MHIIFHTGAHSTDEERLIKCLLRNKDTLSPQGVSIPGPSRYRQILKESLQAMESGEPSAEARDVLIDAIMDDETANRLVLSNAHFFGSQRQALADDIIYPEAVARLVNLRRLFSGDQVEMFMAIRNPATFLPAILEKASPRRIIEVLSSCDPVNLRWSNTLLQIREAVPDVQLTVWCNEDLPLIWGQVIREMAGIGMGEKIEGNFDLLNEIMTKEGIKRFHSYIRQQPDMNEMQLRRVMVAFLDKYAKDDELEEELDLPGWTEELVDDLTLAYDQDVIRIQRIPGINFVSP